jgi:hypothetical protein
VDTTETGEDAMRPAWTPPLILITWLLAVAGTGARGDDPSGRLTRVPTGPETGRAADPAAVTADPAAAGPGAGDRSGSRPTVPRAGAAHPPDLPPPTGGRGGLLEPRLSLTGAGRDVVASFRVEAPRAATWRLAVTEVGGPEVQVFQGAGTPPRQIPWHGRLHGGGVAWSGLRYRYALAYRDSAGREHHTPGAEFTLPAHARGGPEGLTFALPAAELMPRRRVATAGRGAAAGRPPAAAADTVATARARLGRIAERLLEAGPAAAVRIEVLGPDRPTALAVGRAVHAALAGLLGRPGQRLDLYVGVTAAAVGPGAVRIATGRAPSPR